jgi:hypothetical protein
MLRELNIEEIGYVSGGADIIVTATLPTSNPIGLDNYDIWQFAHAYTPNWASLLAVAAATAPDDDGDGGNEEDTERAAIFKATVYALVPGTAEVKELVSTIVTGVREMALYFTSIESKAAATAWWNNNAAALATWFTNDLMDKPQTSTNPLQTFRGIFGGPSIDMEWDN